MLKVNDMICFNYNVTKMENGKLLVRLLKGLGHKYGTRAHEAEINLYEICIEDSKVNYEGPQWGSIWDGGYCTKHSVLCYEIVDDYISPEMQKLIEFFGAEPLIKKDEKYIKGDK